MEIVKFLMSKRCPPALIDKKGLNAVHAAAKHASFEVMKLLLSKEPHLSQVKTIKGWTPLGFVCRYRFDDDAVRIAELLLDAGADIEQGDKDWTPLLLACRYGQADLVSFLLQRGANIKAVTEDGRNCLHLACRNGAFGKDIIPMLFEAGVDVAMTGDEALTFALQAHYDLAETLLQHLPESELIDFNLSNQDPIGSMIMMTRLGYHVWRFSSIFTEDANLLWATLRNGEKQCFDESEDYDIFQILSESNNPKLWILASREPGFQLHPNTGDTVFHLLCRTDELNSEQKMEIFAIR